MFEQVASRPRAERRFSSLAIAVALHAGALAIAVLWTVHKVADPVVEPPTIHFQRGGGRPAVHTAPAGARPDKPTPPRTNKPKPFRPPETKPVREEPRAEPSPQKYAEPTTEEIAPGGDDRIGPGDGDPNRCVGPNCPVAGPSSDEIVTWGAGMSRPEPSGCGAPRAPWAAQQMGISGLVVAEYVVRTDGHAELVSVRNGNAPPVLVDAVRDWLSHCSFVPSAVSGRPISVRMIQPFKFTVK